jgi:glycosyltransferase involved in cell wall biosynthesis
MKRIVVVGMVNLSEINGATIHFREVIDGLEKTNVEVTAFTMGKKTSIFRGAIQIPVIEASGLRQISWNIFGIFSLLFLIYVKKIEVIYSRLSPGDFVGLLCSKITRIPLVVELNGLPTRDVELYRSNFRFRLKISAIWESWTYKQAKYVVGSPGYLKYVQDHFGTQKEKCVEIPLGLNPNLYYPRNLIECQKDIGIEKADFLITWVGTIAPWQGIETLIKSISIAKQSIPEVRLIIVGDGSSLIKMKDLTNDLNLNASITFIGKVPYDRVPIYIGASHICVSTFPSNRGDQGTISSHKTLSYLGCGKTVITSNMDECANDIEMLNLGKVFSADDYNELARLITEVHSSKPINENYVNIDAVNYIFPKRSWDNICLLITSVINKT